MSKNSNLDIVAHEIHGGLDQSLPMKQAQKDIIKRVDEIFDRAVAENDPEIAAIAIENLAGVSRIAGLATAKFFYLVKHGWKNFKLEGTYEEWLSDRLGYEKVTVKRYLRVHEMLVSGEIPKDYLELLQTKPIRELINVGSLIAQGYELESSDWMKLANAPDKASIDKICREIKGGPEKKNSLQGEIESDGSIYAWSNGKKYYVGFLKLDAEEEPIIKMCERIIKGGRLLEK